MTYHSAPGILKITDKTPEEITQVVCDFFSVPVLGVKSESRKVELVNARQIAMFFIEETNKYYPEQIGDMFSRDRTTVLHSLSTVKNRMDTEPIYFLNIKRLRLCMYGQVVKPLDGAEIVSEKKPKKMGRPPAKYSNKSPMGIADELHSMV